MKSLVLCSLALLACVCSGFGQLAGTNPLVRFHTDRGDIDVLLLQDVAPNTVANFLRYVKKGDYDNSFFHRSIMGFIVQGGGYTFANGQPVAIEQFAAVANEFHVSNTRGTLAMAKIAGNPNSATNQWFFNESDSNAAGPNGLDTQNGGFTVFGRIISRDGLTTLDALAAVQAYVFQSPFDSLPLQDASAQDPYVYPNQPTDPNLLHVIWIKLVPQIDSITRTNATTVQVHGRGAASTTYTLRVSTTSPSGSTFTTSVNVSTGTAGNFTYNDTTAGAKKFYRLVLP